MSEAKKPVYSTEDARYRLTASRYIDGTYVHATPEFPAEIFLPAGSKIDVGLLPVDAPIVKPKPHYSDKPIAHPQSAAEFAKGKGKRPSDTDPLGN